MPIGACMVAESAERAGHSVRLLDLMYVKDPLRAVSRMLESFAPDVIGISVRNIDNNDMRNPVLFVDELAPLAGLLRSQSHALIILGGAAVNIMPEELLRSSGVSFAVTGPGEVVFPEILKTLAVNGDIRKLPGVA
jgi:radical SAM superfamily enzyme YgiQ (UPF0313 family)